MKNIVLKTITLLSILFSFGCKNRSEPIEITSSEFHAYICEETDVINFNVETTYRCELIVEGSGYDQITDISKYFSYDSSAFDILASEFHLKGPDIFTFYIKTYKTTGDFQLDFAINDYNDAFHFNISNLKIAYTMKVNDEKAYGLEMEKSFAFITSQDDYDILLEKYPQAAKYNVQCDFEKFNLFVSDLMINLAHEPVIFKNVFVYENSIYVNYFKTFYEGDYDWSIERNLVNFILISKEYDAETAFLATSYR